MRAIADGCGHRPRSPASRLPGRGGNAGKGETASGCGNGRVVRAHAPGAIEQLASGPAIDDHLADLGKTIRVILDDVVLNQVLVAFGDDRITAEVIRGVQRDGTCWCGGTRRRGRAAMRIGVSSWATGDEDVERSLTAILRVAEAVRGRPGTGGSRG